MTETSAESQVYRVTAQVPDTELDRQNAVVRGLRVYFEIPQTQGGGSVFVAGEPPDPSAVQAAIRTYVSAHLRIAGLSD